MNLFEKFNKGLKKTSTFLSSNIFDALSSKKIDEAVLEELESVLISSDIGIDVTNQLINKLKSSKIIGSDDYKSILKILENELTFILNKREGSLLKNDDPKPTVLIFIGVNGSGKTTTIGKLIKKIDSKKILIGACDTFRAAAVDQLREWSIKQNTDFYNGKIEQDPASVAYDTCKKSLEENYDYTIIDTAGRLSNNTNLLNQLIKIKSVINKIIENNKIKIILVLDGTNGSNMFKQVEIFSSSMNINGIIITKIDGTAKGGALIGIAKKYEIPINYVGLGEDVDDLVEFNAKEYSKSILGIVD